MPRFKIATIFILLILSLAVSFIATLVFSQGDAISNLTTKIANLSSNQPDEMKNADANLDTSTTSKSKNTTSLETINSQSDLTKQLSSLQDELATANQTISDLTDRVATLEGIKPTVNNNNVTVVKSSEFQKQVLYLGSADTVNRDWTDTGVEVTINSADYPSGINVVFEAGLSIEGGIAYARLKNKTTNGIYYQSEVTHGTSEITWKSSGEFNLAAGNNIYVVQLKSSSGEKAYLNGARLVIDK